MDCCVSLFDFLPGSLTLWKGWPTDMRAASLPQQLPGQQPTPSHECPISLSGPCPHCQCASVFLAVTKPYTEMIPQGAQVQGYKSWAAMQCQGCKRFILGAVFSDAQNKECSYLEHFPLGKPNDDVASEIPDHIADDFKEALRCRWVDAYNATVEMCRRAVQASCIDLKAPADRRLVEQIDWLANNGIITIPLKQMAHRVRLGGNLGAHPPENPDDASVIIIGPEYADAVLEFTRDFFQHVYVMPDRLSKFTFM